MFAYFKLWNDWLGNRMYLVILTGLLLGFIVKLPPIPHAGMWAVGLFAYITFITALGISFREFLAVLSRPWIPLWALVLIHIVTPLVAWLVSLIFYPDDFHTRLGYLIGAAVPIGVTSILWTSLTKGRTAIALVAVTLDTLLAPALMPLFFKFTIGQSVTLDYSAMAYQLLWMITAPSVLGMLLHDFSKERMTRFAQTLGGVTSKLAFTLVIFINAALVADEIDWSWPIAKTILVSFIMVAAGYWIGYAASRLLKEKSRETAMSMIYCVGLRNISFGVVLSLHYFPAAVAVPLTLYMLFQQPLAAMVPKLYDRFHQDGS